MTPYFCKYCDREHTLQEFGGRLCHDYVYYSCKEDLVTFGKFFLPGDFRYKYKSPGFHRTVGNRLISTVPGNRIAWIAWRNSSKSTIAKATLLHKLAYRRSGAPPEFIAWICETQRQALGHLRYIQGNLETNRYYKYYFGDLYGKGVWTKEYFQTEHGDAFLAVGTGQPFRGIGEYMGEKYGNVRLTGLVMDDFESEKNTKTKESRTANKELITSAMFPALDDTPGHEGWIWLIGTLVRNNTFLSDTNEAWLKMSEEERKDFWEVFRHPATHDGLLTDNSNPQWPDRFPLSRLRTIKNRDFFLAPRRFWVEYMQDLDNPEDTSVALQNIQYHNYAFRSSGKQAFLVDDEWAIPVYIYFGVDLAGIGVSKTHDYHAIVVVAVDSKRNRYILEIFNEHMPIYDVQPVLVRLAEKYSPVRRVNIEKAASGELMRQIASQGTIDNLTVLPGLFEGLPTNPQYAKADSLIDCFGPLLRDKQFFIRREHEVVRDQLRGLPSPAHDDVIDGFKFADYHAGQLFPQSERFPLDQLPEKSKPKKRRMRSWRDSVWNGIDWRTGVRA
ncbi:MAG TPA: hypothetical protein ENI27_03090 [bacterium]|nr:hypothetical protein [bacterium]